MRTGIHQDGGFVAILQRIGEIKAPDAEVGHSHVLGKLETSHAAHDFDAKRIVAKKDVPNPRDQNAGLLHGLVLPDFIFRKRFDFFGVEEEAMAGLAQQAHVSSWIVVENHADVALAFVVLLDAFDGGNLPGQRDVHHVAALCADAAAPDFRPALRLQKVSK